LNINFKLIFILIIHISEFTSIFVQLKYNKMFRYLPIFCSIFFLITLVSFAYAQTEKDQFKIVSIGFYNLENLYDTVNDTLIDDEEFLPEGTKAWTLDKYNEKQSNMAYVISQIGIQDAKAGLSILGVAEIENRKVLEDLVAQESIKNRNYQIVHYDSPDRRGVDVALLYNPSHFKLLYSKPIKLDNSMVGSGRPTRDVLYVKGLLETDTLHILVNHWPSKGGGSITDKLRDNAARLNRSVIDSIYNEVEDAKIIVMGDLNADPTERCLKSYLRSAGNIKDAKKTGMYNPYEDMFRRGVGSNAYRDSWSLFDQLIISEPLTNKKLGGYYFFKAFVYNKAFLIQPSGQYKGYPLRTFSGDTYQGGYSDHFPSYIYLIKKVD